MHKNYLHAGAANISGRFAPSRIAAGLFVVVSVFALAACSSQSSHENADPRALFKTALTELNDGPCQPGQQYV